MRRYRSYPEVRSDHHHASSFWTAPSLCADMIFGNDTSSVFLATEVTNEGVEGGREEKAETGHAQHPEQHAVPSDCRISAPAPVATASGATPRMNERDVIRIGRRRVRAACTAASAEATPSFSFWRANST